MENTPITGYTLKLDQKTPDSSTCHGLYGSKAEADLALVRVAEQYCIADMGSKRFVSGQISNPNLCNSVKEGWVLVRKEGVIEMSKRAAGWWGYSNAVGATLSITPIFSDIQPSTNNTDTQDQCCTLPQIASMPVTPTKPLNIPKTKRILPVREGTLKDKLRDEIESFAKTGSLKKTQTRVDTHKSFRVNANLTEASLNEISSNTTSTSVNSSTRSSSPSLSWTSSEDDLIDLDDSVIDSNTSSCDEGIDRVETLLDTNWMENLDVKGENQSLEFTDLRIELPLPDLIRYIDEIEMRISSQSINDPTQVLPIDKELESELNN